ncbi:MAG: hypothetical protein EA343_15955 [Nodularia sp. (in: Bacteria)]|nr:MAG: hypothetical protein EA343_15955 [Nodularia sp. (in: cyanobacteria)]
MFTRSELEIKTIPELRNLCRRYGLKPTGNPGYKTSYITSLMVFPAIALSQFQQGRGLRSPDFANFQVLGRMIDEMNTPTNEQAALMRITLEGRRMAYPDRYTQEQLLNLHKAKMLLEQAFSLLSI